MHLLLGLGGGDVFEEGLTRRRPVREASRERTGVHEPPSHPLTAGSSAWPTASGARRDRRFRGGGPIPCHPDRGIQQGRAVRSKPETISSRSGRCSCPSFRCVSSRNPLPDGSTVRRQYCSIKCRDSAKCLVRKAQVMEGRKECTCLNCGGAIPEFKRGSAIYCSPLCAQRLRLLWHRERRVRVCELCGGTFHAHRDEQRFRSKQCSAAVARSLRFGGCGAGRMPYLAAARFDAMWE